MDDFSEVWRLANHVNCSKRNINNKKSLNKSNQLTRKFQYIVALFSFY